MIDQHEFSFMYSACMGLFQEFVNKASLEMVVGFNDAVDWKPHQTYSALGCRDCLCYCQMTHREALMFEGKPKI